MIVETAATASAVAPGLRWPYVSIVSLIVAVPQDLLDDVAAKPRLDTSHAPQVCRRA